MSPAGMKAVAHRAGVSISTVSNVLNHPELVREATRHRVHNAITEVGFARNESARQLRMGRSRTLAYVILDPGNPFFTDVAKGAEDVARDAGLALYLCDSTEDAERESQLLEILLEQRVRGVLITPVSQDADRLRMLPPRGVPVVLVDRAAQPTDWCSVSVDDVEGGDLAVSHLLELGHTSIGFVGGPRSIAQVADRLSGARRAMHRAGISGEELTVIETAALTIAEGRRAGQRVVGMPARRRPSAVFCANDLLALGFLQQMTQHDIYVPDEMAIVGYDDIDYAAAAAVPLTSVRQPRNELGRRAAQLLLVEADAHAAGAGAVEAHRHEKVEFTPELIVRGSSARRRRLHPPPQFAYDTIT